MSHIDFGKWIEQEIEKRGWSMRELARRADLSSGGISDVINGFSKPGLKFYRGIAKAFKIPLEHVLQKGGVIPYQLDEEMEILNYFRELQQADRQRLLDIAHAFYEARAPYKTDED